MQSWPAPGGPPGRPPTGQVPADGAPLTRAPSGLFPSGPQRPMYRESHPIRIEAMLTGAAIGAAWMFCFGLLATSAGAYIWLTLVAALVAWGVALLLITMGDRGAAVGVALAAGLGLAVGTAVLIQRWVTSGWPLW